MTQFDERLEGEMKTHEKEMLHKAIVKKYGSRPLIERIHYVMSIYHHDSWTAAEMYAKLKELELHEPDTEADVKNVFDNAGNVFPAKTEK